MRDEMMLQDESFSKAFQTSIDIARKPMQELTVGYNIKLWIMANSISRRQL